MSKPNSMGPRLQRRSSNSKKRVRWCLRRHSPFVPVKHYAKHFRHAVRKGRRAFPMEIGRVEGFRFITSEAIDDHRIDALKYMMEGWKAHADRLTGILTDNVALASFPAVVIRDGSATVHVCNVCLMHFDAFLGPKACPRGGAGCPLATIP